MSFINAPGVISPVTALTVLLLDHNELTTLPESIFLLSKLEVLSLANNPLTITSSLKNLHLKKLVVDEKQKQSIPKEILEIENIEIITDNLQEFSFINHII